MILLVIQNSCNILLLKRWKVKWSNYAKSKYKIMHKYTKLCKFIQNYANLYKIMQIYTQLCKFIHNYANLYKIMQMFTKLCTFIQNYANNIILKKIRKNPWWSTLFYDEFKCFDC